MIVLMEVLSMRFKMEALIVKDYVTIFFKHEVINHQISI